MRTVKINKKEKTMRTPEVGDLVLAKPHANNQSMFLVLDSLDSEMTNTDYNLWIGSNPIDGKSVYLYQCTIERIWKDASR